MINPTYQPNMNLTYEEAMKRWAAKKVNVPIEKIKKVLVELDSEESGGCSTCSYHQGVVQIGIYDNKGKKLYHTTYYEFNFSELITELANL